jgi:hypothetical protein
VGHEANWKGFNWLLQTEQPVRPAWSLAVFLECLTGQLFACCLTGAHFD